MGCGKSVDPCWEKEDELKMLFKSLEVEKGQWVTWGSPPKTGQIEKEVEDISSTLDLWWRFRLWLRRLWSLCCSAGLQKWRRFEVKEWITSKKPAGTDHWEDKKLFLWDSELTRT